MKKLIYSSLAFVFFHSAVGSACDQHLIPKKVKAAVGTAVSTPKANTPADVPAPAASRAPQVTIIESTPENREKAAVYSEFLKELTEDGGVLDKLGIARPHQVVEFLPGPDLDSLLSANGYPVGHWTNGQGIIASRQGGDGLVYEFVIPGKSVKHSFYRDDLPLDQQASIIMHVTGHNDFSVYTGWKQVRTVDMVPSTWALGELMEKLYNEADHDEVSEWYQYLSTLTWAQDIPRAVFETPDDFDPDKISRKPRETDLRIPKSATANILQLFVANLPASLPEWKKEMARRFEEIKRYIPGAVRAKIMNEGWATLMQELILPHTSYEGLHHRLDVSPLMAGVTRPSLSNPYWLGLEGWRNLRARFNDRPEIQGLSLLEKDRAFIKYAHEEIIGIMDDEEFLTAALDNKWIGKHRLALTRKAKQEEWKDIGNPDPRIPNPTQWVTITRDFARVRKAIIRSVTRTEASPRVLVKSLTGADGTVQLGFGSEDIIGTKVPLARTPMVQTMYVYAQIMQRPITLTTVWAERSLVINNWDDDFGGGMFPFPPRWWTPEKTYKMSNVRIVVNPKGEVQVFHTEGENAGKLDSAATEDLQERMTAYVEDLNLGEDPELKHEIQKMQALSTEVQGFVSGLANSAPNALMMHTPTVPRAIEEYQMFLQKRLMAAIARMQKKGTAQRSQNGVRVRVFPTIPEFQFNREVWNWMLENEPAPQIDRLAILNKTKKVSSSVVEKNDIEIMLEKIRAIKSKRTLTDEEKKGLKSLVEQAAKKGLFPEGDVVDVRPSPDDPGENHWGPDKPQDGQGDGDDGNDPNGDGDGNGNGNGDSDGEPGEPSDGAGNGGMDPNYVEIPFELYSKLVGEQVELPNLQRKPGELKTKSEEMTSEVYRRTGTYVLPRIAKKAFGLASVDDQKTQDEGEPKSVAGKMLRGLRLIRGQDIVVKDWDVTRDPDVNAQVTVALDLSGSMWSYYPLAKKIVFDLKAILEHKYPKVTFRFVAFDSHAHAYETIEDLLRAQLGGGTDYTAGFKQVIEVQKDFPPEKFDRYVVGIGDLEDIMGPEIGPTIDQVYDQSQYTGIIKVGGIPWGSSAMGGLGDYMQLEKLCRQMAADREWFGFVEFPRSETEPTADLFRQLFKNPEQ